MSNMNNQNERPNKGVELAKNLGRRVVRNIGKKVAKSITKATIKKLASGFLLKTAPIWGPILGLILMVVLIIVVLTPDLSSWENRFGDSEEEVNGKINEYIELGMALSVNPLWIVAFDMVAYENENLLDYETDENAYHFFSIHYEKFKPAQTVCVKYSEEEGKENECIESREEPEKVLAQGNYDTKKEIQSFFSGQGQRNKTIKTALDNIRAKENVRLIVTAITPEQALANGGFTEEQKDYFNDILESGLIEEEYPQFANMNFIGIGGGAYCSPNKEINEASWSSFFARAKGLSSAGNDIKDIAKKQGIDPVLFAAIAYHETGGGTSSALKTKNNPGGLMSPSTGKLMVFSSLREGLESMGRTLHNRILKDGLTTIEKLGSKYAPLGASNDPNNLNSHWVPRVTGYVSELGGLTMNCDAYSNGMDIIFDGDTSKAAQTVATAGFKYIGKSVYVFGGGRNQSDIARGRFDCSSFVHWAFLQAGINLGPLTSTSTETLNKLGKKVSINEIKVGDIIFWDTYKRDGHVGIYIGNGKWIGSQGSTGVAVESLNKSYYAQRFSGHVRRILPDN